MQPVWSQRMIWLIGLIGLVLSYHRERRLDQSSAFKPKLILRESEGRIPHHCGCSSGPDMDVGTDKPAIASIRAG